MKTIHDIFNAIISGDEDTVKKDWHVKDLDWYYIHPIFGNVLQCVVMFLSEEFLHEILNILKLNNIDIKMLVANQSPYEKNAIQIAEYIHDSTKLDVLIPYAPQPKSARSKRSQSVKINPDAKKDDSPQTPTLLETKKSRGGSMILRRQTSGSGESTPLSKFQLDLGNVRSVTEPSTPINGSLTDRKEHVETKNGSQTTRESSTPLKTNGVSTTYVTPSQPSGSMTARRAFSIFGKGTQSTKDLTKLRSEINTVSSTTETSSTLDRVMGWLSPRSERKNNNDVVSKQYSLSVHCEPDTHFITLISLAKILLRSTQTIIDPLYSFQIDRHLKKIFAIPPRPKQFNSFNKKLFELQIQTFEILANASLNNRIKQDEIIKIFNILEKLNQFINVLSNEDALPVKLSNSFCKDQRTEAIKKLIGKLDELMLLSNDEFLSQLQLFEIETEINNFLLIDQEISSLNKLLPASISHFRKDAIERSIQYLSEFYSEVHDLDDETKYTFIKPYADIEVMDELIEEIGIRMNKEEDYKCKIQLGQLYAFAESAYGKLYPQDYISNLSPKKMDRAITRLDADYDKAIPKSEFYGKFFIEGETSFQTVREFITKELNSFDKLEDLMISLDGFLESVEHFDDNFAAQLRAFRDAQYEVKQPFRVFYKHLKEIALTALQYVIGIQSHHEIKIQSVADSELKQKHSLSLKL